MNVFINGQSVMVEETIPAQTPTLLTALALYLSSVQQQQSFAVALNGDFVGKEAYQQTLINRGDSIDVLFPIQGG